MRIGARKWWRRCRSRSTMKRVPSRTCSAEVQAENSQMRVGHEKADAVRRVVNPAMVVRPAIGPYRELSPQRKMKRMKR